MDHKLYIEYSKTNVRKFTFFSNNTDRIAPAWNTVLLKTKSAPNINKFKDLLDREPKLLVNKFDYDSKFDRKIVACSRSQI